MSISDHLNHTIDATLGLEATVRVETSPIVSVIGQHGSTEQRFIRRGDGVWHTSWTSVMGNVSYSMAGEVVADPTAVSILDGAVEWTGMHVSGHFDVSFLVHHLI